MSAHPKLTELAAFISTQQSYTISSNRRKWIEAGKMLKSYMDELALKSRQQSDAEAETIKDMLECVTGAPVRFVDCTPKT
jgi:hypothetical protein